MLLGALALLSTAALAHGPAPSLPRSSAPEPGPTPVRLVWATMGNYGCSSCQHTYGVIEVIDFGYDKAVDVFYESYSGGAWRSVAAQHLTTLPGNRQLWAFKYLHAGSTQLAIRLRTGGQEHWDNSGGRNYTLSLDPTAGGAHVLGAGSSGISVVEASFVPGYRSTLRVKMIGPAGADSEAAIVYSVDGWFNSDKVAATRTATGRDFDEWTVELEVTSRDVRFAAVGTSGGVAHWDNAYGQNFFCGQPGPFEATRCVGGALLPSELGL